MGLARESPSKYYTRKNVVHLNWQNFNFVNLQTEWHRFGFQFNVKEMLI